MGDEVELKYSVASSPELEQLVEGLAADGVEVGPWREFEMRDRYLDTADGALGRAGYGARIRKTSDGTVLALKRSRNVGADGRRRKGSSGAGAGAKGAGAKQAGGNGVGGNAAGGRALHRRAEYEAPAGPGRDPSRWPESEARALLEAELKGAELRERFVLQQVRRERDVRADGSRAVLSLDRTTVRLGRRRLGTFETLEVELRKGDEALLGTLAGRLEASGLVDPQPASKEQLAQAMVDAARRLPPVPSSPGITPEDPLAEAGRKVLAMHLARMLSREAGSRSGDDMEDVHKMRVATRRMRAAWRVFEDAYRPKRAKRYVAELKAVAAALGGVRDLDVLLGHVGGYGASLAREGDADADAAAGLDPLVAHWRRAREQAREGLIRTLDSAAYHAFVDDYLEFVATAGAGGVQVEANAPSRVRDTAPSLIWRAYEQVRAHDATLRWADVPTLHELRIKGKRLRYTLEFFQEVLGREAAPLIPRVVALQDHLGEINDAAVASGLVRDFLGEHAATLAPDATQAIGQYLATRERDVVRLRRTLPARWRPIVSVTFPRALGRAVSIL